jgi:hypothetical protein
MVDSRALTRERTPHPDLDGTRTRHVLELYDLVRPGMERHVRAATALSSGVMSISDAVAATAGESGSARQWPFQGGTSRR